MNSVVVDGGGGVSSALMGLLVNGSRSYNLNEEKINKLESLLIHLGRPRFFFDVLELKIRRFQ